MTEDSAFKKQVRARMAETGEKYTVARRMVIAGRDPGQPPVALRVYLNPHVDLELTGEAARAYAVADEPGQRDMANRLLADHIEMAGSEEAGVAAGSEILTVQALRVEEIGELVRRRIGRASGPAAIACRSSARRRSASPRPRRPRELADAHPARAPGESGAERRSHSVKPSPDARRSLRSARRRGRSREGQRCLRCALAQAGGVADAAETVRSALSTAGRHECGD